MRILQFAFGLSLLFSVSEAQYNILFIAVDDLRPQLACYGHPMIKSPNIDRLASEGILFERAYCQQAICAPSRISLLSGLYPETTTIFNLNTMLVSVMPDIMTLPRLFRQNGYETVSIGKVYHHKKDDPEGWSVVHLETSGKSYLLPENVELIQNTGSGPPFENADVADEQYVDGNNTQLALSELRRLKDKNFFLAVGFHRPHLPFNSPKKYLDLYEFDSIEVPGRQNPINAPDIAFTNWSELRNYSGMPSMGDVDDTMTKRLIQAYYASVSYVDAQVGILLDELDRLNLSDSTIVVIWGDHGWKLGEYGDWCKHTNFELDTHVPMIFRVPGYPHGVRTNSLAEFTDIFPTLADLCTLEIPKTCQGVSLVPILADTAAEVRSTAYSVYPRGNIMGRTIRSGKWRYVEWRNEQTGVVTDRELYDHSFSDVAVENLAGKSEYTDVVLDLSLQLKARIPKPIIYVSNLLDKLSLEEKVSLLAGMGNTRDEFGDRGVPVFGIKGIPEKGIPDLIMGHGITGVRTGRDINTHSTYFCTPTAMACSWDIDLYGKVGEAIAKEMRGLGQDLNLGPTVNIIRNPLGGRSWECLSEDPYLTSRFIVPYVKVMQSNGIICGPKHFVANNQDHNRFDINNVLEERTLREIYLPAFKAAVTEGGAMNIMGAYNRLNGVFMCQNKRLLTDILREEWGFRGFVLSDYGNGLRSTLAGVYAGLNLEMAGPKFYGEPLLQEIASGTISTDQIDSMLYDILKTMYIFDIFNRPRREHEELVHCQEHQEIAAEVARKTPVLLKNEKNILPLDVNKIKSIAVIGPNAKRFETLPLTDEDYAYYLQGGGSGRTYYFPDAVVDPLTGLSNNIGNHVKLNYAQGCQTPNLYRKNKPAEENKTDDRLIEEAVSTARKADIAILVVGLSGFNESEGWDRTSAGLPGFQERLIQEVAMVNPKTIVVLIAGSYIDVSPWIGQVRALLFVPYCGEKIGDGIADILTGKVSPSGKLSFSWPEKITDYPEGSIFTGPPYSEAWVSNVYSEGIYVGYRWFDKQNIPVRYPFGFGLSYSEFEYSNLVVETTGDFSADIHFSIKNTGKVKASEICQLYVHDVKSSVDRPVQELKGFVKVELQPGEEQSAAIHLNKDAFSFFHPQERKWVSEPGEFEIRVGPYSRNLPLRKVINF